MTSVVGDYSHKKQWVVDRLAILQRIFAIDLCAYAVISNHYHLVLDVDRDQALSWSAEDVIARRAQLFGVRRW
jgi:putative transposase